MEDHHLKIKALCQTQIRYPKSDMCSDHHLPKQHFCINSACKQYLILKCQQCYKFNSHMHKGLNVKKITPMLIKWLGQSWQQIRKENMEIQRQWNICQVNINYCLDIFNQIKKMISNRKLHQLPLFDHLISTTKDLADGKFTTQGTLEIFDKLNNKYALFQNEKIDSDCLDQQIQFRKNKWYTLGTKTKKFSQQALALSQTLAKTVEDKLKYQKRIKRLQKIAQQRMFNINQLMKNFKNAQDINNLKIEVSNPKETQNIEDILQKCQNLKSLTINNKNGKIIHKNWKIITHKLQYLNRLKQLKLTLRFQDLQVLIKLFKEHPNSVRYIQILHLTITDQPKLDLKLVAEFCNTLQLRQAYLTLTRNNIMGMNFKQFLDIVRVHTSLSQLPMNTMNINLSKNKITEQSDKSYCQANFMAKCGNVKNKNLMI